jgi:hypothetical protein
MAGRMLAPDARKRTAYPPASKSQLTSTNLLLAGERIKL